MIEVFHNVKKHDWSILLAAAQAALKAE